MTATRIDRRQSRKPLHKRSRPQMTVPDAALVKQILDVAQRQWEADMSITARRLTSGLVLK
jgi:hypothetical protein